MDRLGIILLTMLAIAASGVFSGSETAVYRLSRLRLRLAVERGQWSAILLADTMRDSSGLLLSLLVGTNLADYVATSLVTAVFLDMAGSERLAALYAMSVAAPLLFVFGNLIPKNIFLRQADTLSFFVAPLVYVSHQVFTWCGAVPLLKLLARLGARLIGSPLSPKAAIASDQKHQVQAILHDTREEGLLSDVQTRMVDRIATIPGVRLSMVMIPLERVHAVEMRSDRAALLGALTKRSLTRLPVWQNEPSEIVGYINVYDVLASDEEFTSLEKFLLPIRSLDADTPITEAINIMRREQLKIVLATRRRGRRDAPLGIVTMKDLVEELLGELSEW